MKLKQFILVALFSLESVTSLNNMNCATNYPVCGTDGVTYPDECSLTYAKMENPDLQIIFDGPCKQYNRMLKLFKTSPIRSNHAQSTASSKIFYPQGPLHGSF